MDTAELKAQVAVREREIDRLRALNAADRAEVSRRESTAVIRAHGITKAQVFTTDGEDRPWFGHLRSYVAWIKEQPTRLPWAEWNGHVYSTDSLLAGHMPETPIRYEDVP